MEELRSTETLDREILEDARRKAGQLLRAADAAAAAAAGQWVRRSEDDIAALQKKFAERIAAERVEVLARLPLERRRARATRAEAMLAKAVEDSLGKLPRDQALSILADELSRRAGFLPDGSLNVRTAGLSPAETADLLKKNLAGRKCLVDADSSIVEDGSAAPRWPAMDISTADVTVRVALATTAAELMEDQRAELAMALLGPEAVND